MSCNFTLLLYFILFVLDGGIDGTIALKLAGCSGVQDREVIPEDKDAFCEKWQDRFNKDTLATAVHGTISEADGLTCQCEGNHCNDIKGDSENFGKTKPI